MIPTGPRWLRPHHITDAEWSEIVNADRGALIQAHITRMENYREGWKCALYGQDERQLALALRYPRAIEAFRAACAQLERPVEVARWRDTDVVVA